MAWSKELIKTTRDTLERIGSIGAFMKNLEGDYGVLSPLENENSLYEINLRGVLGDEMFKLSGETVLFGKVDEMRDAGWGGD
jgi:hypothetical protein